MDIKPIGVFIQYEKFAGF